MPLFSVIIPTFNRSRLLAVTLTSVQRQTFTDYEVIVVDDGSTDDTLNLLRDWPQVRVLTQQNRGPGAARNLGVRESHGQHLAFLDSDDVWFPWTLEAYATVLREPDAPAFLAGKPLRFLKEEELSNVQQAPVEVTSFPDYLASGDEWRWWGVSSFVVEKSHFHACGGFDSENANGEDADLAMKLGTSSGFAQVVFPFTFGYREHSGNVTADLAKTILGVWRLVRSEQSGRYPGGGSRARERRAIVCRHVRPVALECLRQGKRTDAMDLYRATFNWHLSLGRWRFLGGFVIKALKS